MQYRLRTLLIVIALIGTVLAVHVSRMNSARLQAASVDRIGKLSPRAITQYEFSQDKNWGPGTKQYPAWIENRLGQDYLYSVDAFCLVQEANPDPIIQEAVKLSH